MDKVFIENLSIHGKHGVEEHERHTEQEFLLSISAEFDSRKAAQSDLLGDTVNYVEFEKIARDVIENNSYFLVEKIAETIATRIFKSTNVAMVSITICKPAVLANGIPGVTIVRSKS